MNVAELLTEMLGEDCPIRIVGYDGSALGPPESATTVRIMSPAALRRIVAARGAEIGFSRAIVAGEIEIEGDVFGLFDINDRVARPTLSRSLLRPAAALLGLERVADLRKLRPPPPPPEEIRLHGPLAHPRTRRAGDLESLRRLE